MNIVIYNDTRPYHCGSEAVMAFLEGVLVAQGHTLRGGYLNYGNLHSKAIEQRGGVARIPISADDLAWCDAVLVNGEGSIHHSATRERAKAPSVLESAPISSMRSGLSEPTPTGRRCCRP